MTEPENPHVQDFAREIILNHATDVEYMSVGEMLEGDERIDDYSPDGYDALCRRVHDLIGTAVVTVTFSEPGDAK